MKRTFLIFIISVFFSVVLVVQNTKFDQPQASLAPPENFRQIIDQIREVELINRLNSTGQLPFHK